MLETISSRLRLCLASSRAMSLIPCRQSLRALGKSSLDHIHILSSLGDGYNDQVWAEFLTVHRQPTKSPESLNTARDGIQWARFPSRPQSELASDSTPTEYSGSRRGSCPPHGLRLPLRLTIDRPVGAIGSELNPTRLCCRTQSQRS